MGIGDSLYLQAVTRHLVRQGQKLEVCSAWPDIFRPLGDAVRIAPFSRVNINILAHYSLRKGRTDTDQFQDCCLQAGIREPVDLRLDWQPLNHALIARLRRPWRSIVVVQLPRAPMGRTDGFGAELLPDCRRIQTLIDALRDRGALIVQVGAGKALHEFSGIDIDLANQTSLSDLLDVAHAADGFLGYCSYMVPLAESFKKPGLFVWSRRGLLSRNSFVSRITPKKILHRTTSRAVMDDAPEAELLGAMHGLLQ